MSRESQIKKANERRNRINAKDVARRHSRDHPVESAVGKAKRHPKIVAAVVAAALLASTPQGREVAGGIAEGLGTGDSARPPASAPSQDQTPAQPPAEEEQSQEEPRPEPEEPKPEPEQKPEKPQPQELNMSAGEFGGVVIELVEGAGVQIPSVSDPCVASSAEEVRHCNEDGIDAYMQSGASLLEARLGVSCVGLARASEDTLGYILANREQDVQQIIAGLKDGVSYANATGTLCTMSMESAAREYPGASFPIPASR